MKKNDVSAYRKVRKQSEKSLEEVSESTGISVYTLGDIERGEIIPKEKAFDLNIITNLCDEYKCKRLANYFCGNECPIGEYLNYEKIDIDEKEHLASIFLTLQDSLNEINKLDMTRFVKICKDGIIDESEKEDFLILKNYLSEIALAYNALLRWENEIKE